MIDLTIPSYEFYKNYEHNVDQFLKELRFGKTDENYNERISTKQNSKTSPKKVAVKNRKKELKKMTISSRSKRNVKISNNLFAISRRKQLRPIKIRMKERFERNKKLSESDLQVSANVQNFTLINIKKQSVLKQANQATPCSKNNTSQTKETQQQSPVISTENTTDRLLDNDKISDMPPLKIFAKTNIEPISPPKAKPCSKRITENIKSTLSSSKTNTNRTSNKDGGNRSNINGNLFDAPIIIPLSESNEVPSKKQKFTFKVDMQNLKPNTNKVTYNIDLKSFEAVLASQKYKFCNSKIPEVREGKSNSPQGNKPVTENVDNKIDQKKEIPDVNTGQNNLTPHLPKPKKDPYEFFEKYCKSKGPSTVNGKISRIVECKICQHVCKSRGGFRHHFNRSHKGQSTYRCNICDKILPNKKFYLRHTRAHQRLKQFPSDKSSEKSEVPKENNLSKKSNKTINPQDFDEQYCKSKGTSIIDGKLCYMVECKICQHVCKSRSGFSQHFNRSHKGQASYQCNVCDKTLPNKKMHIKHMRAHRKLENFSCNKCKMKFSNMGLLKQHLRSPLTCEFPQHKCILCVETFCRIIDLDEHYTTTHEGCSCHTCGDIFSESCLEQQHHLTLTQPYECVGCDKKFSYNEDFRAHYMAEHKTLYFKSEQENELKYSDNQQYLCEYCAKTYVAMRPLRQHYAIHHLGLRPYKCDTCELSFVSKTGLKLHKIAHTGERPYSCKYCNKSFTQLSYVKVHTRKHIGKKQYWCKKCFKSFVDPKTLSKHVCKCATANVTNG